MAILDITKLANELVAKVSEKKTSANSESTNKAASCQGKKEKDLRDIKAKVVMDSEVANGIKKIASELRSIIGTEKQLTYSDINEYINSFK